MGWYNPQILGLIRRPDDFSLLREEEKGKEEIERERAREREKREAVLGIVRVRDYQQPGEKGGSRKESVGARTATMGTREKSERLPRGCGALVISRGLIFNITQVERERNQEKERGLRPFLRQPIFRLSTLSHQLISRSISPFPRAHTHYSIYIYVCPSPSFHKLSLLLFLVPLPTFPLTIFSDSIFPSFSTLYASKPLASQHFLS